MFLKNNRYVNYLCFIIFLNFSYSVEANTKIKILDYLNSLKYFSASFIQNDNVTLSEGRVYIGEKRVRAEYLSPSKILIILDEDKAMYYNYDLEEDEFFNPKNTNAWFFYDIFRNPSFFENSQISIINNELILKKMGIDNEGKNFTLRVLFEKSPLVLRAVEIIIEDSFLRLSIYNHSYDQDFDSGLFKLISPKLLN